MGTHPPFPASATRTAWCAAVRGKTGAGKGGGCSLPLTRRLALGFSAAPSASRLDKCDSSGRRSSVSIRAALFAPAPPRRPSVVAPQRSRAPRRPPLCLPFCACARATARAVVASSEHRTVVRAPSSEHGAGRSCWQSAMPSSEHGAGRARRQSAMPSSEHGARRPRAVRPQCRRRQRTVILSSTKMMAMKNATIAVTE